MYRITRLFTDLCSDIFSDSNDITYGTVRIFYTHIYYASVVWLAVKLHMNFCPACMKFLSDLGMPRMHRLCLLLPEFSYHTHIVSFPSIPPFPMHFYIAYPACSRPNRSFIFSSVLQCIRKEQDPSSLLFRQTVVSILIK